MTSNEKTEMAKTVDTVRETGRTKANALTDKMFDGCPITV